MTKVCGPCGLEKLLTDFHKETRSKDGHKAECKQCRSCNGALGVFGDNLKGLYKAVNYILESK